MSEEIWEGSGIVDDEDRPRSRHMRNAASGSQQAGRVLVRFERAPPVDGKQPAGALVRSVELRGGGMFTFDGTYVECPLLLADGLDKLLGAMGGADSLVAGALFSLLAEGGVEPTREDGR